MLFRELMILIILRILKSIALLVNTEHFHIKVRIKILMGKCLKTWSLKNRIDFITLISAT